MGSICKLILTGMALTFSICPNLLSEDLLKQQKLVDGNNQFALEFYSQIKKRGKNTLFSPYSISTALAMTYTGADGNTKSRWRRDTL